MRITAKPLVAVRERERERERESNNLKNEIALISVVEKLIRNISVISRDSLLHNKTRRNTGFVMQ